MTPFEGLVIAGLNLILLYLRRIAAPNKSKGLDDLDAEFGQWVELIEVARTETLARKKGGQ